MTIVEEPRVVRGSRPLVMLVEDSPRLREPMAEVLRDMGCDVVTAQNGDKAVAELWALPRVDLVCADIGLVPNHLNDMSGLAVARMVHDFDSTVPVAAYTGKGFDLTQEERDLFVRVHVKGGGIAVDDLADFFSEIVEIAKDGRRRLNDERRSPTDPEERIGHDLRHILKRYVLDISDPSEIESALHDAGYQIRLISPDRTAGLRRPCIVWVQEYEGEYVAQLFGKASIYAIGASETDAVERLVDVMRSELADLTNDRVASEDELRSYLELLLASD